MIALSLVGAGVLVVNAAAGDPLADQRVVYSLGLSGRPPAISPWSQSLAVTRGPRGWRLTRRSTAAPAGEPQTAHRHGEHGPVILTEDGPLHCEGHLFKANPRP